MESITMNKLLNDIQRKDEELKTLKATVKRLEKYEKYEKVAEEVRAFYDSFVHVGFSEEQSFEILKCALDYVKTEAFRQNLFPGK